MLAACTWFWGDKYPAEDVAKLACGVRKHLRQDHEFFVITDAPGRFEDWRDERVTAVYAPRQARELFRHKGCFARLTLFSPELQQYLGSADRIVNFDLDSVVVGPLDPLFNRAENFVILQGANALNPCPYNGSLFMLRPGTNHHVWDQFSLERARQAPYYEFPDDQGWLAHVLPGAAAWHAGERSGVYAFHKPGWQKVTVEEIGKSGVKEIYVDELPADARLVVFPGWRSPSKFAHLEWVRENWQ